MKLYKSTSNGHRTILHFDNSGEYGRDFKEVIISYNNGRFNAQITNGFYYCGIGRFCETLKEAIAFGKEQITKEEV